MSVNTAPVRIPIVILAAFVLACGPAAAARLAGSHRAGVRQGPTEIVVPAVSVIERARDITSTDLIFAPLRRAVFFRRAGHRPVSGAGWPDLRT